MKKTLISIAVIGLIGSGVAIAGHHGGNGGMTSYEYNATNAAITGAYTGPNKTIVSEEGTTLDVNLDVNANYLNASETHDIDRIEANSVGTGSTLTGATSSSEALGGTTPTRRPVDPYAENTSASRATVVSGGESTAARWDRTYNETGSGSEWNVNSQSGDWSTDVETTDKTAVDFGYHKCSFCQRTDITYSKTTVSKTDNDADGSWDNKSDTGSQYEYTINSTDHGQGATSKGGTLQDSESYSTGFAMDEGTNRGQARSNGDAVGVTTGAGAGQGYLLTDVGGSSLTTFTLDIHGDAQYAEWDNFYLDKTGRTLTFDASKSTESVVYKKAGGGRH